jgi:pre-rRNA-processing protein TSR2
LAVQENWGGADSAEKRDWFAGAISDLFADTPASDMNGEFLEEFMLQVMVDEFDVNIEDGSGEDIAESIVKIRKETLVGDFERVNQMWKKWDEKQKKGGKERIRFQHGQDQNEDTDWDSDDDEDEDSDVMDISEDKSQPAKAPKEKIIPEVDEDGFTKVIGKRGR